MSALSFALFTVLAMIIIAVGVYRASENGIEVSSAIAGVIGLVIGIATLHKTGITDFSFAKFSGSLVFWVLVSGWILATILAYVSAFGANAGWPEWVTLTTGAIVVVCAIIVFLFSVIFAMWLRDYNIAYPIAATAPAKTGFLLTAYTWIMRTLWVTLIVSGITWLIAAINKTAALVPYKSLAGKIAVASLLALIAFGIVNKVATSKVSADTNDAQAVVAGEPTDIVLTQVVTTTPIAATATLEFTAIPPTAALIPPTATPIPPTVVVLPTATPRDFTAYPSCLDVTELLDPNTGVPLINIVDPYVGVSLEVEIYATEDCVFYLAENEYAIMADWYRGQTDPVSGEIIDECPTGPECEGVSVLFRTDVVPAYNLVHFYVHPNGADAVVSFLGTKNVRSVERGEWEPGVSSSFACRYLKNSLVYGYHDNENIRVPYWAHDSASIFFHTGCVDFEGDPGYDNPIATDTSWCSAPTGDNWAWLPQGFWFYQGPSISFVVPQTTAKVLYRNTGSGYANKAAMSGENVSYADYAYAYCE